ncbi:hypothetical protein N9792_05710 [Planktomarina temperata]|nr:hypothetical protein [Planktomarina temperata]
MAILGIIGFVVAVFTFSIVAGFIWTTLPKWLGLEEEYQWDHEPKIKPNKIKNILGWLYFLVAFPVGLAIGAGVSFKVFTLIVGLG